MSGTSRKPGSNLEAAMVSQVTFPPLPQSQYFFSNMELLANKIKPNITVTVFFINERRHLSTHPPLKKSEKSQPFWPPVLSPFPPPIPLTMAYVPNFKLPKVEITVYV